MDLFVGFASAVAARMKISKSLCPDLFMVHRFVFGAPYFLGVSFHFEANKKLY